MTKTAKTFRLSSQAVQSLARLVEVTGSNETAIVEMALVRFGQFMARDTTDDPDVPPPEMPDGWEPEPPPAPPAFFEKPLMKSAKPAKPTRKRHTVKK